MPLFAGRYGGRILRINDACGRSVVEISRDEKYVTKSVTLTDAYFAGLWRTRRSRSAPSKSMRQARRSSRDGIPPVELAVSECLLVSNM
jgi:hypothetical protein